jgi:hypothetical protein
MDKKLLAYLCITIVLIVGGIVAMVESYNPDLFLIPGWKLEQQPYKYFSRTEHSPQNEHVKTLIGGIGALLLSGYLFVICYLNLMKNSKAESDSLENLLHKISIESGRTEYELFVIASKEWSIAEARIDDDFRDFIGASILPYYVKDFIRKNHDHIDKSLRKEKEIDTTSLWVLIKAFLIFPGFFYCLF